MGGAIGQAELVAGAARQALTEGSSAVTVFNSLSWPRKALVYLPSGATALADGAGTRCRFRPEMTATCGPR